MCGFSQKIFSVVGRFLDCLRNLKNKTTEKQFNIIKENNIKKYGNMFLSPRLLASDLSRALLGYNRATLIERYEKLLTISYEEFKNYEETFSTKLKLKVLTQGNLTENDAKENVMNILGHLTAAKIEDVSNNKYSVDRILIYLFFLTLAFGISI